MLESLLDCIRDLHLACLVSLLFAVLLVRIVQEADTGRIRRILIGFLNAAHALGTTDADGLLEHPARNVLDTFQGAAATCQDNTTVDNGIDLAFFKFFIQQLENFPHVP